MTTEIQIKLMSDGWWILGTSEGVDDMGPYRTQQEAQADYRGVKRLMRDEYGVRWKLAQEADTEPREVVGKTDPADQKKLFSGLGCLPGQQDLWDDV